MKYYKIINSNRGTTFIYKAGLNRISADKDILDENVGLYYTDIKHIFAYLDYGPIVCDLEIPQGAKVIYAPERMSLAGTAIPGYKTNKLIVTSMRYLNVDTIKDLINKGADITIDDYHLFRWALHYRLDVWDYLLDKYMDIISTHIEEIFI